MAEYSSKVEDGIPDFSTDTITFTENSPMGSPTHEKDFIYIEEEMDSINGNNGAISDGSILDFKSDGSLGSLISQDKVLLLICKFR